MSKLASCASAALAFVVLVRPASATSLDCVENTVTEINVRLADAQQKLNDSQEAAQLLDKCFGN